MTSTSETTKSKLLLENGFDPITRSIAFFNIALETAANSLRDWRIELAGRDGTERFDFDRGSLSDLLPSVEPLVRSSVARELLMSTSNDEWVAYFAGTIKGADSAPVGHLAERLQCRAVYVQSSIPAPSGSRRHPYGGTQLLLIADHDTEWLNHERSIAVGQDGSSWRFGQEGQVQPFESLEAYERPRIRERFTHSMLVDYCAALGLRPFDESFYKTPAVLITNSQVDSRSTSMSLQEARQYLELDT